MFVRNPVHAARYIAFEGMQIIQGELVHQVKFMFHGIQRQVEINCHEGSPQDNVLLWGISN